MTVLGHTTRIGVFGGTFDPPQNGHLAVAQAVLERLQLDYVLFVPAGDPWQKTVQTPAAERFEMVEIALLGQDRMSVSSVDIEREGPTYTIDTLTDLARLYPGAELFFILGDDAFSGITSWKNYEQLAQLATIVVVSRHGTPVEVPTKLSPSVNLLEMSALPISSTLCRERIMAGHSLEGLVPAGVAEYIEKKNLYRRTT
ncbi:nicotinate-nucleotide adenylyltransferase [Aurantimicrobium minutum]|uniref:Probable nicotinate-nucleotide adenylyltransferase n=1 Tax=Aurantimicrobium minutum TaxID=708131 RepID=A0A173LWF6_9MICO|nr:nicotinate-nucleotide adenylyltransferase [Aurantimicrobium minutum]BAU99183.1 probable nicotinate mononucleotide adenylyltransferase [Aurantimicrobium minutum]